MIELSDSDSDKTLTARLRDFMKKMESEVCDKNSCLHFDSWGRVAIICSGSRRYEALHCMLTPGHKGRCFCHVHHVEFDPDNI